MAAAKIWPTEIALGALDLVATSARRLRCLFCGLAAGPELWRGLSESFVVVMVVVECVVVLAWWGFEDVRMGCMGVWNGGACLILHVLIRINDHLIGLLCFVGGRIKGHVGLGLLSQESVVVTAVFEGAGSHHVYGRHDARILLCLESVVVTAVLESAGLHHV